jgi:hypothetical protein
MPVSENCTSFSKWGALTRYVETKGTSCDCLRAMGKYTFTLEEKFVER